MTLSTVCVPLDNVMVPFVGNVEDWHAELTALARVGVEGLTSVRRLASAAAREVETVMFGLLRGTLLF